MNHEMATTNAATINAQTTFHTKVGSSPACPAISRRLFVNESADLFRDFEIELGEAAFAVSRKSDAHFVVAHIDVGMMILFFRDLGDAVHEFHRLCKIIEFESSFDV